MPPYSSGTEALRSLAWRSAAIDSAGKRAARSTSPAWGARTSLPIVWVTALAAREPQQHYESASDPEALEAARHLARLLFGGSCYGATPWADGTVAVYVCGYFGDDVDYEDQCAAAGRARDGVERRLAEMGFESRGRAMLPDGNYGVAWVLLVAAPPVLTQRLLYRLGEVAGDAWREHYQREPWLACAAPSVELSVADGAAVAEPDRRTNDTACVGK